MNGRTKGGSSGLHTYKVGSVTLLEQECSGKLDRRQKVVTAVEPTAGEQVRGQGPCCGWGSSSFLPGYYPTETSWWRHRVLGMQSAGSEAHTHVALVSRTLRLGRQAPCFLNRRALAVSSSSGFSVVLILAKISQDYPDNPQGRSWERAVMAAHLGLVFTPSICTFRWNKPRPVVFTRLFVDFIFKSTPTAMPRKQCVSFLSLISLSVES